MKIVRNVLKGGRDRDKGGGDKTCCLTVKHINVITELFKEE